MRNKVGAALAVMVCVLVAGCGDSGEKAAPKPVAAKSNAEFIESVATIVPMHDVPDEMKISLGHKTCEVVGTAAGREGAVLAAADTFGTEAANEFVDASIDAYCPNYR